MVKALAAVRGAHARDSVSPNSPVSPACEFLLLTARRAREVCAARWDDMDLYDALWTARDGHWNGKPENNRFPLSSHAVNVLHRARKVDGGNGLVFPHASGKPLSPSPLVTLFRGLEIEGSPHSVRTGFA